MRQQKKKAVSTTLKLEESSQVFLKQEDSGKEEPFYVKQEDIRLKYEQNVEGIHRMKAEDSLVMPIQSGLGQKSSINNYSDTDSSDDEVSMGERNDVRGKKPKGATSAKNIIKNYGRALQNFAMSNIVLPYVQPLLSREKVDLNGFQKYISPMKKQVRSIAGLRKLLLITDDDNMQTASFKRIFQELCVIFIKYFSVNWIFSGKLLNKAAHLKCRFKMLRRIKDPENFTYLKGFL